MRPGIPATIPAKIDRAARPRLLIVGASTRAAAWSAVRAGFQPVCADQFADRDLQQIAEVVSVQQYPQSLPDDLTNISADAWMFVGAMENHRRVLAQMQQNVPLGHYCGPGLESLSQLRDPAWLAKKLAPLGCYPPVILEADRGESRADLDTRRWLRKPLAGGGGRAISIAPPDQPGDEPCYWQQFIPGTPFSALYLLAPGQAELLMLSRQWIGVEEATAPTPFTYCGSVGPWPASTEMTQQLTEIGATLIAGVDDRGLLGVDLVWDGRKFWVVEVNPRYTASAELWELTTGRSAVGEHLAACGVTGVNLQMPQLASQSPGLLGKLILYADQELIAPDLRRFLGSRPLWSTPFLADVPQAGSTIAAGWPICTLFARGATAEDCFDKLSRRADRIRAGFRSAEISAGIFKTS